ncbi:MAG: CCA tRNA nucleotidyltransferase [Acidobacteriota bacterium]|nr:CCA tRNA nucleotidyltransferase [Acidobacteriota bacterium]
MHDSSPSGSRGQGRVILETPHHPIDRAAIDPDALKIMDRLDKQGFLACLVGGAVRDLMLGRKPKDFDIATDARPGQIKKRFANAYVIGRRFRLVHVHFPGDKIIEVATFRRSVPKEEEEAHAAREAHGEAVEPIDPYGTPREDAFRRDITINALLYDAVLDAVIDYTGGLEDLERKRVRIIGDPETRFIEDPVRIWRVIRHAARLGFSIEESAEKAIRAQAALVAECAGARLYEELNKDLAGETRPVLERLRRYGILRHILGPLGRDYEADAALFARLLVLLERSERCGAKAVKSEHEDAYALLFYPWVERLFGRDDIDLGRVLSEEIHGLRCGATIPKLVRADAAQILAIAGAMVRGLRTGRMRWSLQKRAHYPKAEKLFFLVTEGALPGEGRSFETLFRRTFPRGGIGDRPRRRRTRRPRPAGA